MQVGNHPRVLEYDGAFKCYACDQSWGAVTGHPPMPEKCERKERRKKDRRAKEQPVEQNAGPTQRKEPEVMVTNLGGAPAAPDVAAMVKRLNDYAGLLYERTHWLTIERLMRDAAALIEKLWHGWIPVERTEENLRYIIAVPGSPVWFIDGNGQVWHYYIPLLPPPPERP